MTVKTELERLKRLKEDLESYRNRIQGTLDGELLPQEKVLQDKAEELSKRKSSLAKTLQEENQKKLEAVQKDIEEKRAELKEVLEQLQENQAGIATRENDTTLYIQEQVHLMVPQFLEWVAKNKEAIGYDITRSFYVAGVVGWNNAYDVNCYTGDVGIFEESKDPEEKSTRIVCSENFYFSQICNIVEDDRRYGRNVKKTDWYAKYLKDFTKTLLEELEKSYKLGEELKLTIQSPEFTLELV